MAEDMGMSAKEICEVLSNNTGYYKEVFDYWLPMRKKIAAWHRLKNPNYGNNQILNDLRKLLGS